jgi:hypothetical protein
VYGVPGSYLLSSPPFLPVRASSSSFWEASAFLQNRLPVFFWQEMTAQPIPMYGKVHRFQLRGHKQRQN